MKRLRIYSFPLLAALALGLLAGCQAPGWDELATAWRSQKVTTALSVAPSQDPNRTKSSYTGTEDAVLNWNLLVFENGVLKAKYYKDSGREITLDVMTDRPYRYYAVANVGDITSRLVVGTTVESDMASLRVEAFVGNGLPMAWISPEEIAFTRQQLADGNKLPVQLTRLVGRFDIVVNQSGLSLWSFTATSLALRGVSTVTPFSPASKATAASVLADEASAADLAELNRGGATHYYPIENCYGNLLTEGTSSWNKIPGNIAEDAFPTYIEIGGKLRMTDGSNLEKDVTYRFYLGENASNNFDVERNVTHTVTLLLTDASVTGDHHDWKVETGSFTDTRSLAFTHEEILLPGGSAVEEPVVRTPAGLKYKVEIDRNLMDAGVTVDGYAWGDACEADRLTLTAPSDVPFLSGHIRLKTLDGAKTAEAVLTVGRRLESLRIGLWPSATEERFHRDTTLNLSAWHEFWVHAYACYSDGTMIDVTPGRTFSYNEDAFTCYHSPSLPAGSSNLGRFSLKRKKGIFTISASYTDEGVTCTGEATLTLEPGVPTSLIVVPGEEQTLLTGGQELTYTLKVVYAGTDGEFQIDPDDATWTIQDENMLEYVSSGTIRTHYKRGQSYVEINYSERGGSVMARKYVTVTSNLINLEISPSVVYLPACGREILAEQGVLNDSYRNDVPFTVRAYYHDGTEEDVTRSFDLSWDHNHFLSYYVDGYWHVVNALHQGNGEFGIYRAYSPSVVTSIRMGPNDNFIYSVYEADVLSDHVPQLKLLGASYTCNNVTLTAKVMGTIINDAKPQRLILSPNPQEAYSGGKQVRFTATCIFDNGITEDVTSRCTWQADGLAASQGGGLFTTGSEGGTTQVHASYTANGVTASGSASLLVREPVVRSVELQMKDDGVWVTGDRDVNLGTEQEWRVRVRFEDVNDEYFTEGFTLSSTAPDIVSVHGVKTRAEVIGTATVKARYRGVASNEMTLTVGNHHYTYDLKVTPTAPVMPWNGSRMFFAYLLRFDNGVLDTSFGSSGQEDVSAFASWSVDASLLAVAEWVDSAHELFANNQSGADADGRVYATYNGMEASTNVCIEKKP